MHPHQGRTIKVLSASQVVGGIGNGAGFAVGALCVKAITGSTAWAAMAGVMITLGAAAFTIPLARLAIAYGRRPALALGWAAGALGAASMVIALQTSSLPLSLIGTLLIGAGYAVNLQSRFAAVDLADAAHVGRSLAIVIWATTIGAVVGPNLSSPGATLARSLGLHDLAGTMLLASASFVLAGLVINLLLRPDPLVTARQSSIKGTPKPSGIRGVTKHLHGSTLAGVVTVCCAHAVMVAVMTMTPIHMHDHGSGLNVIGFTISLHFLGMFAFSPVMGWLNDRWGSAKTIVMGQVLLLVSLYVAGTSGSSATKITIGLFLVGLGWSAALVAGSAMLNKALTPTTRPAVQGFSDLIMNLAGAAGGVMAGLVMARWGFASLNVASALVTLPVILILLARRRSSAETP